MFDDAVPPQPSQPVEDIFAGPEPGGLAAPQPAATPLSPVTPLPAGQPVAPPLSPIAQELPPLPTNAELMEVPASQGKRWLMIGGGIVAALVLAAGFYVWWISRAPAVPTDNLSGTNAPSVTSPNPPSAAANPDSDGDGLINQDEAQLGTDPSKVDSDDDGLFDREEVKVYRTNPLNPDTDGDGFTDGQEVQNGYNPTGPGKLLQLPAQP